MLQPLQGAVEVQSALHCSMSSDFIKAASDVLVPDGACPEVNRMQFLMELLIKLGLLQVSLCNTSSVTPSHARVNTLHWQPPFVLQGCTTPGSLQLHLLGLGQIVHCQRSRSCPSAS